MELGDRVDVAMPTWNSASTLRKALEAIRADRTFPMGRLLVVDRDSTDGTLDIAREFGAEIASDTVSYGSALQKSIEMSRTPWIASIDSDIVIPDGWFAALARYAREYAGDDLAAVQSMAVPPWMIKGRVRRDYERRHFGRVGGTRTLRPGERGYTGYTLIRRDLAAQARLAHLEAYADKALAEGILALGGVWLQVPVFVEHRHTWREVYEHARWNAAGNVIKEGRRPAKMWGMAASGIRRGMAATLKTGEPRLFLHAFLSQWGAVAGNLRPQRFRKKFA